MKEQTFPLFVYGTFKNHETLDGVVGHTIRYAPAILPDYFHKELRNGYSDVVPQAGSKVTGYVVQMTQKDLNKADKWETEYERHPVTLADGTEAFAYFPKPEKKAFWRREELMGKLKPTNQA